MKVVVCRALVAAALLSLFGTAMACRCAERTLAEYFRDADEVFVGTLVSVAPFAEGQREFSFAPAGEPYKKDNAWRGAARYVSETSSAACAVEIETGAVYVVFVDQDPESNIGRLNSCNGTRIHRRSDGSTAGFSDVPARFVLSQLAALGGLDALEQVAAAEPDPTDAKNENIVGLLDVAGFSHGGEFTLRESPDAESAGIASVDGYADLDHRESGYEVDAAVVFAEQDGWFRVRHPNGAFGWLSPDAAGTYWPLEDLLPNRLNYLTAEWNRYVWPDLGAGIPVRLGYDGDTRPREQSANIVEARRLAGSLWLKVEVLAESPCSGRPEKVLARGWVPAYSASGTPVAWFYSRGC